MEFRFLEKINSRLNEAKASGEDKKQIKDFVDFLKKKNVKRFGGFNAEKLLDTYGKLDTDFLITYWPTIRGELERAKIKAESASVESQNLIFEAVKLKPTVSSLKDVALNRDEITLLVALINDANPGPVANADNYITFTVDFVIGLLEKYIKGKKASQKGKLVAGNVLSKMTDINDMAYAYFTNTVIKKIDGKKIDSYTIDYDGMTGVIDFVSNKMLQNGEEFFVAATPYWDGISGIPLNVTTVNGDIIYDRLVNFSLTWDVMTDANNYINRMKKELSFMEKELKRRNIL